MDEFLFLLIKHDGRWDPSGGSNRGLFQGVTIVFLDMMIMRKETGGMIVKVG